MTTPTPANLYTQGFGSRAENVEIPTFQTRAPASSDVNWPIGKRWVNTSSNAEYSLTSISASNGALSANWTVSAGGSLLVSTLTGDSGGAISPSSGNINVLGTANQITTTGSGSTVTWSLPSAITAPGSLTTTTGLTAGSGFTVSAGAVTVTSGTSAINISADAAATTVNLATGAAVKALTLGSTNTTSSTVVQAGSGGISLSAAGAVSMTPVTGSSASTPITITGRVVQATFTGFTTASGSSQVFELTDSAITGTTQAILVSADNLGSNDAQMTIQRVLQATGSLKVTLKNNGAAALNGDVHITAWILN